MKEVSCSEYQRLVDDVGDLERLPAGAFRHVEHCEPCERFGRELVALRALLREPARVPAPPDFDARLARAIRTRASEPAPRAAWAFPLGAQLASAAAAVVLAAGAALYTGLPGDPTAPTAAPAEALVATAEAPARAPEATVSPRLATPEAVGPSAPAASTGARASRATFQAVSHRVPAPAPRSRAAARPNDEATLLLGDAAGVRVVSVPRVIVGAQEVLPVAATPVDEAVAERVSL